MAEQKRRNLDLCGLLPNTLNLSLRKQDSDRRKPDVLWLPAGPLTSSAAAAAGPEPRPTAGFLVPYDIVYDLLILSYVYDIVYDIVYIGYPIGYYGPPG